jgi:hypothetical protein
MSSVTSDSFSSEEKIAFFSNEVTRALEESLRETMDSLREEIAELDFSKEESRFEASKLKGVREGIMDVLDLLYFLKGDVQATK